MTVSEDRDHDDWCSPGRDGQTVEDRSVAGEPVVAVDQGRAKGSVGVGRGGEDRQCDNDHGEHLDDEVAVGSHFLSSLDIFPTLVWLVGR